ncbi:hypothetical protein P8C59_006467 [Phyllachora maydis]|uniref:Uncharacterized protein n=1 Tax=Phyllachora maydis TaxID=1825666 RepID=A0AAD9MGR8_9PEZI|nr:hypothetical protein P8C59_006467 [Phyllachora maydis]
MLQAQVAVLLTLVLADFHAAMASLAEFTASLPSLPAAQIPASQRTLLHPARPHVQLAAVLDGIEYSPYWPQYAALARKMGHVKGSASHLSTPVAIGNLELCVGLPA